MAEINDMQQHLNAIMETCIDYSNNPCGLPGHALMTLIAKLAGAVNWQEQQPGVKVQRVING